MANVAVILSGCGFKDGAEIHESVLTLLALAQKGHRYRCFAPDMPQKKVVNHLTGKETNETRNVLVEAARIARGEISPLSELHVEDFDALMIPGGFGAVSNLSTYAEQQTNCEVNEHLRRVLLEAYTSKKPIGATCISPATIGKVFQGVAPLKMTLGQSPGTVSQLEALGMQAETACVTEMVADTEHRVFTTPCYMEPADLAGMFEGIKKVIDQLG